MVCDCQLTEEIEAGAMGCGEGCINRTLMIEWYVILTALLNLRLVKLGTNNSFLFPIVALDAHSVPNVPTSASPR